jgi:hypothetical protein
VPQSSRTLVDSSRAPAPPYNPGYGIDPPLLVGRNDILGSVEEALATGPRSPWFGHGLVGDRGVGKTVLLNAMQQLAAAKGWAVVAEQAVPDQPLVAPLLAQIVSVAGTRWSKLSKLAREVDLELSLGLDVKVVKAEARLAPGHRPQPAQVAIRRVLTAVGEYADTRGAGLMVTIDEAHAMTNRSEIAVLAAALQLVVKRDKVPVAVYFAGLPGTRQVLRKAGTFFERLGVEEIAELSDESATLALVKPAADAGVAIDNDALAHLVAAAGGHPYLVQLVGYHAWRAKGSRKVITLADARGGVGAARKEMHEVFSARFEPLPPLQQAYLQVAARLGEVARVEAIGDALHRDQGQLSSTRAALVNRHRILRSPRYGEVRFAIPAFARWIAGQPDVVGEVVAKRRKG